MIIQSYEEMPGLNQSRLKEILKSPLHFHKYRNREIKAFGFGTLVHMAVLEPELAKVKIKAQPEFVYEIRKGTKIERVDLNPFPDAVQVEFNNMSSRHRELLSKDLIWVGEDELEGLSEIIKGLRNNDQASSWLKGDAKEQIITGELLGVPVKGIVDVVQQDFVVELKTTESLLNFEKSVFKYGYDFQLAFYCMITNKPKAKIIAIENKWPFAVKTFDLSEEFLQIGRQKVIKALEIYKECESSGNWNVPQHGVLTPPSWYLEINSSESSDE